MDAVEFLKARARICRTYDDCVDCILSDFCAHTCDKQDDYQVAEQAIANVSEWAKEHPVKTRQSEFLARYSDAEISDDGLLSIAPCQLDTKLICGNNQIECEFRGVCDKCRRDFWLKEIKED